MGQSMSNADFQVHAHHRHSPQKNLTTFTILGSLASGHESLQSMSNADFQVHAHHKHSPQKKISQRSLFWAASPPDMKASRACQMLISRSMPIISIAHKKKFNQFTILGSLTSGHESLQSMSNA